jgi:hypothetical protein
MDSGFHKPPTCTFSCPPTSALSLVDPVSSHAPSHDTLTIMTHAVPLAHVDAVQFAVQADRERIHDERGGGGRPGEIDHVVLVVQLRATRLGDRRACVEKITMVAQR